MNRIYLNDEVLEELVEKEVMLGCLYEIGRDGDMAYFFEIGSVVYIYKIHVDTMAYEDLKNNSNVLEINELVYLFEENVGFCKYPYFNNENNHPQSYDYEKLILDGDVIIGFNRKEEENEEN